MISVIIPTLNAGADLAATLTALVPGAVEGLVREVIVVDGGSSDRTVKIAEGCGAEVVMAGPGRGQQMIAGAARARFPWLLFLHADTELTAGWERDVAAFIERIESGRRAETAAAFSFALDDEGFAPRMVEHLVQLRCLLLKLPYGDQGLLISRNLYMQVGGFRPLELMEDVDLVGRLGRRIVILRSPAITSARRFRSEGYLARVMRNQICLGLYYLRFPIPRIAQIYAGGRGVRSGGSPS